MRKIKVGIIQQANVADMRINLMNLAKSIESCAAHGAQLVVLQSCITHSIFARRRIRNCLIWQNLSPGHRPVSIRSWRLPTT